MRHAFVEGSEIAVGRPAYEGLGIDTNGTDALLAWTDGGGSVHVSVIRYDMQFTDRILSIGARDMPAVRWNGSEYLIAWTAEDQIVGRRVTRDGTPVDPLPIGLSPRGYFHPAGMDPST